MTPPPVALVARAPPPDRPQTHNTEINATQLDLVGEVLDPRDTGVMDMLVFATHLSASARRLESALHTKLFASVEAHGGIGFFSGYAQAESRLLSYNAMMMLCDDLETGITSEELVLLFSSLDASDSGHIPLDVLVYSMVAAWSATTARIWMHVRKSPLGQLRGEQAARVLTMGKSWVAYPEFAAGLAEHGIELPDEDLLLLLVQLGSSIDGVVHAADFANQMDHEMALALHGAYAKIEAVLGNEGVTMDEALQKLDERGAGMITHHQLVEFLHTLDIGLPNEDLTLVLARLDPRNEGKIEVAGFKADVAAHSAAEVAWAKTSDALGPSGGAQLSAFVGDGSALATPALLAALRQLGIDLSDGEFECVLRDLDPRGTRYAKVEAVVLLVRAHRERVTHTVWLKVLADVASGADALQAVAEAPPYAKAVFSYEQLLAGLVTAKKIKLSESEVRTLLLALDPSDTGSVRAGSLEHEVQRAKAAARGGDYKEVVGSARVNVMQTLEAAQKELQTLNAKPLHSEGEKLRVGELTQHVKLLEAIIRNHNKWQKEVAVLSGKPKPDAMERSRLEEVQRHLRQTLEAIKQSCMLQGELTSMTAKGALSEAERAKMAAMRNQARDLSDQIGRVLKLQTDLGMLNTKAIAKSGLTEAEAARRVTLRENLEPVAAEVRVADRRRAETQEEATKRAGDEAKAKRLRVEQLWKELSLHMRRRDISAKKLYRQFDESGSGELSYWEFFKGVQSIGISFDEEDTDLLMADVDVAGAGVVPYDAFYGKLKALDPAKIAKAKAAKEAKEAAAAAAPADGAGGILEMIFGGTAPAAEEETKEEPSEEEEEEEDAVVAAKGANLLEAGTPVMAQHSTGDYFRATVVKDNGNGTCDVQFVLASLGRDAAKSKKVIRSLAQEEELRALWLEVSRAVGRRGAAELRTKADFAGLLSHEALVAWLEAREMDAFSEHDKFVLLADVDPMHSGAVPVVRFLEKLEHFRARAKILGLTVYHRHDKEVVHEESGDEGEEDQGAGGGGDRLSASSKGPAAGSGGANVTAASTARMGELEALIFAMAKRQQELALALSASEARTASLNAAVQSIKDEPVLGGEPLLGSAGPGGLVIMPDTKDGQVMWLNKTTGMRFVRQDGSEPEKSKKKKKKKRALEPEDMV